MCWPWPPKRHPPPAEAATALKAAPAVLVTTPEGSQENLSRAVPYLAVSDKAQWLPLPKGTDCLKCRAQGTDLRELVFDALPPAAVGLPEDEPEPAFGPAPAKKRPAMPDIAGLIQATFAEVKAFHEAKFDGLKASMKEIEGQAREAMAKHGKDYDQIMADAKTAPRTPFDQMGKNIAAQIRSNRDALKARGILPLDKEADMTKAAEQAEALGADSEARWQDGQKKLAEAAKKIEAAKAAKTGQVPEEMKARFKEAGMDLDAMTKRTREDVISMHASGKSLSQAVLADVDLSGLDLSGADFTGCRLAGANFSKAKLDGCIFAKTMAQNADFSGASLKKARFDQAMLMKTSFKKAMLSGANLRQAALKQADLEGADLSGVDLYMATVGKANLTGAVFSGANLALMAVQDCLAKNAVFRGGQAGAGAPAQDRPHRGGLHRGHPGQLANAAVHGGAGLVLAKATFQKGAIADCELPGCDLTRRHGPPLEHPGLESGRGGFPQGHAFGLPDRGFGPHQGQNERSQRPGYVVSGIGPGGGGPARCGPAVRLAGQNAYRGRGLKQFKLFRRGLPQGSGGQDPPERNQPQNDRPSREGGSLGVTA